MRRYYFILIIGVMLVACNGKPSSNSKEFLNWESPMIKNFGVYYFSDKTVEVTEQDNYLKVYLIIDDLKCDLLERNSSVYSRFFVYNENDTTWWVYSGDTGLYKSVIKSSGCDDNVVQVSLEDSELPLMVKSELD